MNDNSQDGLTHAAAGLAVTDKPSMTVRLLATPLLALALLPAVMIPWLAFSTNLGALWHISVGVAFVVAAFCGFTTWMRIMSKWILAIEISELDGFNISGRSSRRGRGDSLNPQPSQGPSRPRRRLRRDDSLLKLAKPTNPDRKGAP